MKISFAFLRSKQRRTPPGLCLLTDAARSEALLKEWQQELLTKLTATASATAPAASQPTGERA